MSQYDFLNQPLSGTSENSGENGTRDFGITDFGTRDLGTRDFGTIDFGFSEEPYTFADHKKIVYGNAFKDLEERNRTVEEALSDEIESGEIDLADVDYEARKQIADYYKRSQEDQDGKEYLVRGALLRCSCGTNSRKLNLSPCHGVYFKEHPLVHKMDCKQGKEENITWYGVCDQADLETEEIVVVNDRGQKQTGRKCCPEIIGSWRNTYSKAQIADNHAPSEEYELYDALTVDSYLICRHGGIITPVNSGQSREVLLEEFKNGQEAFDKIVKYDKENSVSDEMEAESEDSLTTDDHMNESDKEEGLLIIPNPGESITVSRGTDLEDQTATVSQWHAWSWEYSVVECNTNEKFAGKLCCRRLNYAVDTYECNDPADDLLMFNLEGYDQAVFAGAMVEGYADIGDIVQVTLEDDSSFYFLILDTKNIQHESKDLKPKKGETPQCQCEWGHGYLLSETSVQLCVCEFITAGDYKIDSALDAPSGAFLYRHRVVKSQIVDHIFIDDSYVR